MSRRVSVVELLELASLSACWAGKWPGQWQQVWYCGLLAVVVRRRSTKGLPAPSFLPCPAASWLTQLRPSPPPSSQDACGGG